MMSPQLPEATGFTVASGRLVSPALRQVILLLLFFPPPSLHQVILHPFPTPRAPWKRGVRRCVWRGGGCVATWLQLSLHSSRLVEGEIAVWCSGHTFSLLCRAEKRKNGGSASSLVVEFSAWERFLGTCFNFAPFVPRFVEEGETGGGWVVGCIFTSEAGFFFFSPCFLSLSLDVRKPGGWAVALADCESFTSAPTYTVLRFFFLTKSAPEMGGGFRGRAHFAK